METENPKKKKTPEQRKRGRSRYFEKNPNWYYEVLTELKENWPAVFNGKTPLALGTYNEVKSKLDIPSRKLFTFFSAYCKQVSYLESIREGNPRYNLQGVPVGEVTKEEAAVSTEMQIKKFMRRSLSDVED